MRTSRAGILLLTVLVALTGCTFVGQTPGSAQPSLSSVGQGDVPAGTLDPAAAVTALAALPVAAKTSLAGYERGCGNGQGCVFGAAWADVDHNGCDQRNDVLHRDLTQVQVRPGTHGCVVVGGGLEDPYTGTSVTFTKAHAAQVPIDHVVPLAAAWMQGAAAWAADKRQAFANDLGNLIATTQEENSAKGDSTADEWVPGERGYGCSYATVIVTVKTRYVLAVTSAEAMALKSLLATCCDARRGITLRDRTTGEPCHTCGRPTPSVTDEVISDE